MNLGAQLLCMIFGYAIGAFPTALLFARMHGLSSLEDQSPPITDQPISSLWRTTNRAWVDIVINSIDVAKGFLAVHVGMAISGGTFLAPALAGFFAILGHNYNLFVKARYGRGLPAMAGVAAAMNPLPIAVFFVCWLTGYFVIRRNYYVGLLTATFATPILMYTAPELLVKTFMRVPLEKVSQFTIFVVLLAVQVFVRHIEPMREVFNSEDGE
jgi:glycerol-3-phosphate acyltransferase PlsY